MASPQKENGYTPIANEILEELVKIDLLGAELRVLLFIIRKTYGYHKKSDQISFTQFEKGTGISRQTINKTLKNLMAKGLIVKICLPGGNIGYSFIKDHENWVVKTHLLVKGKWVTSQDVFTKTSKDVLTHKRKKENTKENSETSSQADIPSPAEIPSPADIPSPAEVFNWNSYLEGMIKSERKDLNIIGFFLKTKGVSFDTKAKAEVAIRRHLKPAKELIPFDKKEIGEKIRKLNYDFPKFTLETVIKELIK